MPFYKKNKIYSFYMFCVQKVMELGLDCETPAVPVLTNILPLTGWQSILVHTACQNLYGKYSLQLTAETMDSPHE